jgi:hypothetical protein
VCSGCGGAGVYAASDAGSASAPAKQRPQGYEPDADADAVADSADLQPGGGEVFAAPPPPPAPAPDAPEADEAPAADAPTTPAPEATAPTTTRKPLLIYTATLTLAVFETDESIETVEKLAIESGGYLVKRTKEFITVRVPAEKFREMLKQFAQTGDELARDVTAQDVTEQYQDLAIRMRNAEALRNRLEKLLADAKNVKEALAVENQLQRVTAEIELYKGKLKRLRELITFSTITVRYEARPVDQVESEFRLPFPWLDRLGLPHLLDMEGY